MLGRPHRVRPTLDAFSDYQVYFIPDPDDEEEITAIKEAGGTILFTSPGGYAIKINEAIKRTTEPLIFLGADDLEPQPGWFEMAVDTLSPPIQVVGVNDLISRSRHQHATHFLLSRDYDMVQCDGFDGPLCELYDHSCIDDELIATAKHKGVYAYAENSYVKHLHPDVGLAPIDATYVKGREKIREDRRIWKARRIWYLDG